MIVERERARMRFRAATWWDLEGTFDAQGQTFGANLVTVGGTPVATGRDFTETGELTRADAVLLASPRRPAWCRPRRPDLHRAGRDREALPPLTAPRS